jgi:hypothetical protein
MQGVGWLSQREGILGSRLSYEHMGEEGGHQSYRLEREQGGAL